MFSVPWTVWFQAGGGAVHTNTASAIVNQAVRTDLIFVCGCGGVCVCVLNPISRYIALEKSNEME